MATFPLLVGVETTTTAGSTSHVLAVPPGLAGDLLLIVFPVDGNPTINSWGGATEFMAIVADASNALSLAAAYKVSDGTETTITVTTSSSEASAAAVLRFRGFTGVPEAGTAATGTSQFPDPPSLSPSAGSADYAFFAVAATDAGVQLSGGSGQTFADTYRVSVQSGAGAGDVGLILLVSHVTGSSLNPASLTLTTASEQWVANTFALRGAALAAGGGVMRSNMSGGIL